MSSLHRALGLTDEEYDEIVELLEREPNELELSMYAVMWSEHCSYKSSRIHLRRLPSEAPWVLVGPGEGAGVVDIGDGIAVAMRIESHNHPSFIEPKQGAATGVGGILRDVFTMGARPIATMDPLRFGTLDDPHMRWVFEGVVDGISSYGNSVGVPTVGGEVVFDPTYQGNPLVNVFCLGVMPTERLVLARASGAGNLAVLVGSSTGRDGIGGVSMASEGFDEESEEKRPAVQVGDPFEEKRLIEACLELLDEGLVVGVQDLGGAGLTCATSETASKAGSGMDVDVTAVHLREPGMTPTEIMTSESQERMLAIVRPDDLDRVLELCRRWEVRASVVGRVNDTGRLRIMDGFEGDVLGDVPASTLDDNAPVYDRPLAPPDDLDERRAADPSSLPAPADCTADLLSMLVDTNWVSSQYDHQLFLNTVVGPGGDATVLRVKAPGLPSTRKAVALSADGNGRWCAVDPRRGTAMVVAESTLNVACAGARPLALVNCLNFGNPEHPEVMWQFSESVDGMSEACAVIDIPIIGGNVSFYNETRGHDIDPSPVVAVMGVIDELTAPPPVVSLTAGEDVVLLGRPSDHLGGSRWAVDAHDFRSRGVLPELDLVAHVDLLLLLPELLPLVSGIHDVSEGGIGLALAEMAVRSGVGVTAGIATHAELFSEASSRVLVSTSAAAQVVARAQAAGVPATVIGTAGGDRITMGSLVDVSVADAVDQWRNAIPRALVG